MFDPGSKLNTGNQNDRIVQLSPQEEALQQLCKQLLKSKLFRGYYLERRFVEPLESYRDVISLQRTERELEKLLLDICRKIKLFYMNSNSPDIWIGVTHGYPMVGTKIPNGSLETCVWVEMDDLAFGQYWFSIKTIRFRQNEILLKLKMVREVEDEIVPSTPIKQRKNSPLKTLPTSTMETIKNATSYETTGETVGVLKNHIDLEDFIKILRDWGISIKHTVYDFMSNDINKDNIKGTLRFFALLIFSLLSGVIAGIKFLGIFTIHFMFELSRFTHVVTPIVLKMIDILNKMVGGFYILIAMIWRDTFGRKVNLQPAGKKDFRQVEYDRPLYRSIKYNIQDRDKQN